MDQKKKISGKLRFLAYKMLQCFQWCLSDRRYLNCLFFIKMGKPLHLNPPVTFNEKLQWLKLYNRRDEYTDMVDKLQAKRIAAERVGEKYIVPTLGYWDSVDEIDFDSLPDRFVLKTTHGGGGLGVVVCKDKSKLDIGEAKKRLNHSLKKSDIYKRLKEWPYKNVKRRIIAEELLDDGVNDQIFDYKFYCFNGKAHLALVCYDRGVGTTKYYYFNRDWEFCRINTMGKNAPEGFTVPKPENIDEMFALAEKLSESEPFLRVDFYDVKGRIYFGEYTFYPASGFKSDLDSVADLEMGKMIDLTLLNKKRN